MKKLIMQSLLAAMILAPSAFGQEKPGQPDAPPAEEITQEEHYAFPTMAPEVRLFGGYRIVGSSGSGRADQYEYLHSSPVFGGEARIFSFPHRFHLDLDFKDKKDYFGDISYAYEDMVLFRGVNRTLFHNLDAVKLIDLNTATSSPGVSVRDADTRYGVRFGMSNVFLRFKTHDFPFHVYVDGTLIDRSGTQQQRSLLGSGYYNNIVRDSQSRNIDMQTKNVVVGMNSHLGPVEVDISHGEARLEVNGDKVLFDSYAASGGLAPRAAGEYPHNLLPEFKGSSNTLKLHTSYTGGIVASATFSKIERDNRDSGVQADYFIGAGEVSWTASNQIAFFLKYRHKEIDLDAPRQVTITDRTNPANSYAYPVESPIASMTDTLSAVARLRPLSGVTLLAEYAYENVRRSVSFEWSVPPSTQKNSASVSANLRIIKGLNLKTSYTHKTIEDPAYNTDPNRSDEARVALTWTPRPQITTLLSYTVLSEKRTDMHFVDAPDARRRDVNRNGLLGSITFLPLKDLSVTASYSYFDNKARQDIVYHDENGAARVDPFVPFKDMAHAYGLNVAYLPCKAVSLSASASHTIGSGTFYPADPNLTSPVSVALFSETKTRETIYSASGEYRFRNGYAVGMEYRYSDFRDVLDNPYNDLSNGRAHVVLLTFSKKW
ncbi:MAG: MtrB/PioB family outer membrane beta-barrel protein [Nitrospiraceae bacterium]|nr:MtrB/PioB family outer membrane beta-barrel protein [Nitrospiraceae bacterium]